MIEFFKRRAGFQITLFVVLIFVSWFLLRSVGNSTTASCLHGNIDQLIDSSIEEAYSMSYLTEACQHNSLERPDKNILIGKTRPATNENLVPVDPIFATRSGMYMHRDAFAAFKKMHNAASSDGIPLTIVSAFRSFNHQRRIWENKWNGKQILDGSIFATEIPDPADRAREILRYSAMPGTSRHHWGTDIDLNSVEDSYFEQGAGKDVYSWLVQNASSFGFCQPYTSIGDGRTGGYEEEKWHWSYMPVANLYLDTYLDSVLYKSIVGFEGWETAVKLDVIKNYVLQINEKCNKFEY